MSKQLRPLTFAVLSSLPTTGIAGDTVFLSTDKKLYTHDGTTFKSGGSVTGPSISTDGAIVTFSGTGGTQLNNNQIVVTNLGALQTNIGSPQSRSATAVDLQTARSASSQVAQGNYSTISGGNSNTVTSDAGTICGGVSNSVSGIQSTISGGAGNNISSNATFIGGGSFNSASGYQSVIGGGYSNYCTLANGVVAGGYNNFCGGSSSVIGGGYLNSAGTDYSCIPGGSCASAYRVGQFSYSSGKFSVNGDAQFELLVMRCKTTNATQTEMSTDGQSVGTNNILTVAPSGNAGVVGCQISIVALGIAGTNKNKVAYFTATPLMVSRTINGVSGLVGGANINIIQREVNSWNVALLVTGNRLAIAVTGDAATTIQWVSNVYIVNNFY